jgi:hypothetical protein
VHTIYQVLRPDTSQPAHAALPGFEGINDLAELVG